MDLSRVFDVKYCNEQLDTLSSELYATFDGKIHVNGQSFPPTKHTARKLIKKYIQLSQIFVAIKTVVNTSHLKKSLKKMRILAPTISDEAFVYELSSSFDSDYGDNCAQNYAISIKQLHEIIHFHKKKLVTIFDFIFVDDGIAPLTCSQVNELVDVTKQAIHTFLTERDEATKEVFHMLEVFVERKRFEKIVSRIESLENNFLT